MFLILLGFYGQVDARLVTEIYCTMYRLRSSGSLRVVAIQNADVFIRGCYL